MNRAIQRVLLLFLPTLAMAEQTGDALTACAASRLQSASSYQAGFEQSQHLAALSAPLVSRGEVELQPSGNIRWHVLEPIDYELMIDVNGVVTSSDGATFDHPAIMRLVRMLLTMDTRALVATFAIQGTCDDQGWSLQMTPTDEMLKGLFVRIDANGNQRLTGVELVARSGDRTVFSFADFVAPKAGDGFR